MTHLFSPPYLHFSFLSFVLSFIHSYPLFFSRQHLPSLFYLFLLQFSVSLSVVGFFVLHFLFTIQCRSLGHYSCAPPESSFRSQKNNLRLSFLYSYMSTLDSSRKREATDRADKPRKRRSRHRKQTKARKDDGVETRSSPPPDSAETNGLACLNHFQNSQVFSYSSSSSKWSQNSLATSSESPTSSPTSLRLLTWNTFSSSPEHRQSQALAILSHLAESRADIVSLQEVSKPFESLLRRESWLQAGWVITSLDEYWRAAGKDGQGKGKKEGKREGVLILVRRELWSEESEIGFVKLKRGNNEQAKALVVLRILRDGSEIVSRLFRFARSVSRFCADWIILPLSLVRSCA